jgi:hypothetical protein
MLASTVVVWPVAKTLWLPFVASHFKLLFLAFRIIELTIFKSQPANSY